VKSHFIESLDLELEKAMMLQNLGTKHKSYTFQLYTKQASKIWFSLHTPDQQLLYINDETVVLHFLNVNF